MVSSITGLAILFLSISFMVCVPSGISSVKAEKLPKGLSVQNAIYGSISDAATNIAIANAVLELKNTNFGLGYYKANTNKRGIFHIKDFILHINYKIEVSAPGYVNYFQTNEIHPGKYNFKLVKEGIIAGVVMDSSNRPMSGVEVKLESGQRRYSNEEQAGNEEDVRHKPLIATTGQDGKYQFNKLPAGMYLATFQKTGYITETAQISNIKAGDSFNLPMQLFRNTSLAGKIMIQDVNIPAANIDIALEGRSHNSTVSNQDGSFNIEDVRPGSYKLSLSHRGFEGFKTDIFEVKEGQSTKDLNFTLSPKNPELEVYSDRYTFVIGQQAGFNLKTFRLEKVKVRLYHLPLQMAMKGRIDSSKIQPDQDGLKLLREWEEGIKDFTPYEWREQHLAIAEPLPPGGYCIEVAGENNILNRKLFSVTSIGVVVKRSKSSVLAYATDLTNNQPVNGAPVIIFDATPVTRAATAPRKVRNRAAVPEDDGVNNAHQPSSKYTYNPPVRLEDLPVTILTQGKTSKDGLLQLPVQPEKALAVMVVAVDGSYAICAAGTPGQFDQEKEKLFIYTDRPVYRAGDKVSYKIVGKSMGETTTPLKAAKLFYQIRNTDVDATIDHGTFTLDEWGTYKSEWNLSAETRLGTYQILVGLAEDNLYSQGTFYVDQYRKPEFKIDITAAKEFFTNRDQMEFKVEAKYLFGAPLKGALIRYRFYETKLRDNDTKYWWEEDESPSRSYNKIKLEGDKYLDENGIALLKLSSGDFPYDREITLEVTIVDKSNVSISARSTVKVGRGDFYIKIQPSQSFFAEDEKKTIKIKTIAHNAKPQSAIVDVKVYRYLWRSWQRIYVHDQKPIFSAKVTTDASGIATIELPEKINFYGEYDIVAESKDSRGNMINASRVIWIYSYSATKIESRFKNLELSVSETSLEKPGEITCLIKSRYTDAYVCLTVEGKDIYEKKVLRMDANILPVKFNIKQDYAPNVFITATMQRGRALFTQTTEVSLPNRDVTMNIELTADKTKYLPGEKIKVNIKATNETGKPVKGDLSLGVVDEAIYLIRHDHTPKMRDYFYAKNSNWVLTNYSYPFTILAGVGKDGKTKIREKFADTAYWNGNIKTDEQGLATVVFELPDNLTTWRLTARGHDLTGRVGEKKNEVLVTQDLIARIGKPRFFIEGDQISILGIINSNANRGLPSIKTEFKAGNKMIEPEEKTKLSLPAYGVASNYYNISIPEKQKSVELFFKAVADKEAQDALKITVPVYSRGMNYKLYGMGDLGSNRTVNLAPLKDTADFEYRPEEILITVNPSPITQLLRGADYLANFPYGCIEQTINGFLPALALRNLLKQKGLAAPRNEKLDEKIKTGIERILQYQNSDGTWGWWSGDSGNEFITGYVLYSLHTAQALGYSIDKTKIDAALTAVDKMLQHKVVNDDDARIFLFYTTTLWGKWNKDVFNDLAGKTNLNAYCRAYLIMAMAMGEKTQSDKAEKARMRTLMPPQIVKLKAMQKKDRFGAYWAREGNQLWGWPGGNTEITAHVLSALAMAGDKSTLPSQIVSSLMKRSKGAAWKSTKETATVIFAVCKYYQQTGGTSTDKGKILFRLDGKDLTTIEYDAEKVDEPHKLTRIVKLNKNTRTPNFKIEAVGSAASDVSFNVTMNGNLYFRENRLLSISADTSLLDTGKLLGGGIKDTFSSFFKSEDTMIQSINNGLVLRRDYAFVTRVRDMNNNEYLVPQRIDYKKGLKIGDEILVRIKFQAQDDFEYLVLEDYLPSGFEVIKKNVFDDYQPYSHSERWDNRMVFFFTKLSKNSIYEIGYTMRAELPGNFLAKPARMECMYEPNIQGWSAPAKFSIRKK